MKSNALVEKWKLISLFIFYPSPIYIGLLKYQFQFLAYSILYLFERLFYVCLGRKFHLIKAKEEGKGGSGPKTVTSVYLVRLGELMHTLHNTEPHPIRCLVPNTHKHQLTCNGVLGGISICTRGFPNRMLYPDFKNRYAIFGAAEINSSKDNKTAVYALLDKLSFPAISIVWATPRYSSELVLLQPLKRTETVLY